MLIGLDWTVPIKRTLLSLWNSLIYKVGITLEGTSIGFMCGLVTEIDCLVTEIDRQDNISLRRTFLSRKLPWITFTIVRVFSLYTLTEKNKLYITKKRNKVASKWFFTTKLSTNYHCNLLAFCSWFCVGVQRSCFVNTHVKSILCTHVGRQRGVHSEFYRWSVLVVWDCQKNTCRVWHLMLVYEPWDVARRGDQSRCCKSFWWAKTQSGPCGHVTLRHGISAWPAVF